jgi:uncharacterized protein
MQSWGILLMQDDRFEWDDAKAASNSRKHRVTFDQAREAFDDPNAVEEPDDDPTEERWKRTVMSATCILIVIYTQRGVRTRIITARRATKHEQADYHRQALP